jgi:hypothetical protein
VGGQTDRPTGNPQVVLNQPMGDGYTVFVLHGRGWPPGQQVAVGLAGGVVSPSRPTVDQAGTFNYAVNQQHEFFRGPIPAGTYQVLAGLPGGGRKLEASFSVHP